MPPRTKRKGKKLNDNNDCSMAKEIIIDGITYVPKGSAAPSAPAVSVEGMKYCIIRTDRAGVFAGYVKERKGQEATILNARRLWYWKGAATLSQLAMEGVEYPKECKFAMEVPEILLTDVIEVLPATAAAKDCIDSVDVWKAD